MEKELNSNITGRAGISVRMKMWKRDQPILFSLRTV